MYRNNSFDYQAYSYCYRILYSKRHCHHCDTQRNEHTSWVTHDGAAGVRHTHRVASVCDLFEQPLPRAD